MAVFGPFLVHGWPYRAKNGVRVLTLFPMFPVIFCMFSLRCDHDLSLFYCPYLFTFLIFYYKKAQHSTQHTHSQTHTHSHTHAHLPLTVILRVVWVRVTRGKTRENAWKRQSQGNLWRRLVAMLTGKSFVCATSAKDPSNHLVAGSLRSFPRFQGKKRMIWGLGYALFSTFSQTLKRVRSRAYFRWTPRASDNTTWAIHGKQKSGDEEWT